MQNPCQSISVRVLSNHLFCLIRYISTISLEYTSNYIGEMMKSKIIAAICVVIIIVAAAAAYVSLSGSEDGEQENRGGFYSWNPTVVEVNGNYSNCTPSFMTIAETVYKAVYGDVPSFDGISIRDIPSQYLYKYTDYVKESADGTLTVKTFDNTSVGTSEAFFDKNIRFTPTQVLPYTDAYVDTIYCILCDYYGETPRSGDASDAEAALWKLIPALPSSVRDGVESKYGLDVPDSVKIIGTSQEDLVNHCAGIDDDTRLIVFMSEFNIRSTSSNSWWNTNTMIESNNQNIQFVYILSNSPAMVLSTTEMIGKVIGYDNTDAMMTSILAEIYVMQNAIDQMHKDGKYPTFYVEMANGNAVGSNTLMGGIFAGILKLDNVYDGSLMGSAMSDEDIVRSEPEVIGFYTSDTRSMDEKMRVD